jgi:hypothetical protein
MNLERISVARINPAPYNPRKNLQPGDPEYEKLARSIDEFGCVEPLVWNKRSGHLVGGHQLSKFCPRVETRSSMSPSSIFPRNGRKRSTSH